MASEFVEQTVTTRTRITGVEIINNIGVPTTMIFRTTTFFQELQVEVPNAAKTLILDRANENNTVPGCDITYKQVIDALWGIYNDIPKPGNILSGV